MKCPKCGKVLMKTNEGNYICTSDCKYVFNSCKNEEKERLTELEAAYNNYFAAKEREEKELKMEIKKYCGKREQMIEKEKELCKILKTMMDENANFIKPLSEFWRGSSTEQVPGLFGLYGLWMSGEVGSKINGKNIADYYENATFGGSSEMKSFMKKHGLYLDWYDPKTIMVLFK